MTTKSKEQHIIDVVTHYMNGGDILVEGVKLNILEKDYSPTWDFERRNYEIVKAPREFEVLICGADGKPCFNGRCDPCANSETITTVEKL